MSAVSLAEQLRTSSLPVDDERRAPPRPATISSCVCVCACPFFFFFSVCTGQKLWSGTGAPRGRQKRARHARGPRARPRNFFFFFSVRINPEDAMCRSETGHHISCCCCCCCCRHKGTAQRAEKTEVEGPEKSAKRLLAAATTERRGQLHRMMMGPGHFEEISMHNLGSRSRGAWAGFGGVGRVQQSTACTPRGGQPRVVAPGQTLSQPWKHTRTHTDQAALFA